MFLIRHRHSSAFQHSTAPEWSSLEKGWEGLVLGHVEREAVAVAVVCAEDGHAESLTAVLGWRVGVVVIV